MPRKILIVGAGQSGLQLALGLQQHGYHVTVMTSRTPQEIRSGKVMSTQAMFGPALQIEEELGLNTWEREAPDISGIQVTVAPVGDDLEGLCWTGHLTQKCQSVDQRVKMAGWLEEFEKRAYQRDGFFRKSGLGSVVDNGATVSDLKYAVELGIFDLILVAAGRGELGEMFRKDVRHDLPGKPLRELALCYVRTPKTDHGEQPVGINLLPGAGELFIIPALTTSGPCHILFIEAIPGGELDKFRYRIRSGEDHLKLMLALMRDHFPAEYQRFRDAQLTDRAGFLTGRVTPVVREPVATLGSGIALGMGDVVVRNDPVTGQGSNMAAHCAAIYQQAILAHGNKPFDRDWMQQTFGTFWELRGQPTWIWTNAMLQPPPVHVSRILAAAQQHQEVRDRFADGFADPARFFEWFMDPHKAYAYLAAVKSRQAAQRRG